MQILSMADWHKENILNGDKAVTLRNGHREQYAPGDRIEIKSEKWSCIATIAHVGFHTYETVPEQDYLDNGFTSQENMFEGMKSYYSDIKPSDECTVIRWKDISNIWEK